METSEGTIRLSQTDIESFTLSDEPMRVPLSVRRKVESLLDDSQLEAFWGATSSELARFRDVLDYPTAALREIQAALRQSLLKGQQSELERASETIRSVLSTDQILYLPTYRRIEKDLKTLMSDRETSHRVRNESELFRRLGFRTDAYAELIEFGMEDVRQRFAETLSALNDNNRKEFNALAGSYLRDVIKGEGRVYAREEILELTDAEVSKILRRVEENTLSREEKRLLTEAIERLRSGLPNESDAYVAHFLAKLVYSSQNLTSREKPVTDFVRTCNGYLEGKELIYDELSYRIFIRGDNAKDKEIDLPSLSSGEKQVVSLFAHLYLSGSRKFYILIDEPELSLSVPWQQKLLPDVWNSGNCTFLAAVTHSPFVFDNEMEPYVIDLQDQIHYPWVNF